MEQQSIEKYQKIVEEQKVVCAKHEVLWIPSPPNLKIGISKTMLESGFPMPINALRYPPDLESSGWFVWAGDYSDSDDFFVPLHIEHVEDYAGLVLPYLGLPPGWRFQIDNKGYEDVWEDKSLLDV